MSAHIEWLSTRYLDITAEAKPGEFANDGSANEVAALIITSQHSGDGIVIEGRPDNILERAREILRAAELLVEKTMRDPELRRLYGITSQPGTVVLDEADGEPLWVSLSTPEAADMSEVFAAEAEVCAHNDVRPDGIDTDGGHLYECLVCGDRWNAGVE